MIMIQRKQAAVVTGLLLAAGLLTGCSAPSPTMVNIDPTWSFRMDRPHASADQLWPDSTYRQAYVDGVVEYNGIQAASVAW
jgi:hypothetical protein